VWSCVPAASSAAAARVVQVRMLSAPWVRRPGAPPNAVVDLLSGPTFFMALDLFQVGGPELHRPDIDQ